MTIQLTEQQQQALANTKGEPLHVVDPRTNAAYVLVPADQYATVLDAIEDDKVRRTVHKAAIRNAVGRANEEV